MSKVRKFLKSKKKTELIFEQGSPQFLIDQLEEIADVVINHESLWNGDDDYDWELFARCGYQKLLLSGNYYNGECKIEKI